MPPTITRELRYLEVYTAHKMRNLRAGTFTSRLRGPGFDFDEHRRYRPGDDVRRIDWNVTARFRQPYVRETHAERELNVIIALDLSASMGFGTVPFDKKELMLYIAACFAFSAASDQINFGLLAFGRQVLHYWPPRRSKGRAWRALDELWQLDADPGPTAIAPVATFLQKRLRHASVIFIVSDFLTSESLPDLADLRLLTATHDVVGVVVEDPSEASLFDATGEVRVRDPETGARRRLALSGRTRRRYSAAMRGRRAQLEEALYGAGMEHAFVTDRPASPLAEPGRHTPAGTGALLEPLIELFSARRRAS
ncbi:MAG: DUF58 domain-containing protein [Acidobacteriota bacterium]|nr:DUF58 domain-containing protein [Acidobacteriota bacterium]